MADPLQKALEHAYEQMQSYIEKDTVNKLSDIYTIGMLVVTN